jgi:glutathione-specific gamma-glutamylcyclotransferase
MDSKSPSHWVFGYGSLMWRPGFDHVERRPALVRGYHRSLCVYSYVHRGTPERPGLVLGLDTGGSCHGMAFRVAPERWRDTLAYLRAREQVTMVYRETTLRLRFLDDSGETAPALAFVVDRKHAQYAGKLDLGRQVEFVRQGIGQSGTSPDYVASTLAHLREMGIRDARLEAVAAVLTPPRRNPRATAPP